MREGREDNGAAISELSDAVRKKEKALTDARDERRRNELREELSCLRLRLASELAKVGHNAEALSLYESILQEERTGQWYLGMAQVLASLKRCDEALAVIDKVFVAYTDRPEFWNCRGIILLKSGNPYEALRHFDHARAMRPGEDVSLQTLRKAEFNRGLALIELGCYRDAAYVLSFFTSGALVEIGVCKERVAHCHLRLNNIWQAIAYYQQCFEFGYRAPEVYAGLCDAYLRARMHNEAKALTAEALRRTPDDSDSYADLAEKFISHGCYEPAREVLGRGIMKFPRCTTLQGLLRKAIEEQRQDAGNKEQVPEHTGDEWSRDWLEKELEEVDRLMMEAEDLDEEEPPAPQDDGPVADCCHEASPGSDPVSELTDNTDRCWN